MTEKQIELKIDNLKAHLLVVREDVSNQQQLLSDINEKVKQAQNTLTSIKKEKEDIEAYIATAGEDISVRQFNVKQKEKELNKREKDLDRKEDEQRAKMLQERDKLSKAIRAKENELGLAMVNFERFTMGCMQDSIKIKKVLEQLDSELRNKRNELGAIESDIELNKHTLDESNIELQNLSSKLSQIKEEIDSYVKDNRIIQINQSLAAREDAVSKREKNFLILKGRLQKVLTRLYPGQSVDNLI